MGNFVTLNGIDVRENFRNLVRHYFKPRFEGYLIELDQISNALSLGEVRRSKHPLYTEDLGIRHQKEIISDRINRLNNEI
ncbi:MAG: hypothetical protein AABX77_01650 [Nanoarchaeota archaeon]